MATYTNPAQGLTTQIPDDGEIFRTDDPNKLYMRMGNQVMTIDLNGTPPVKNPTTGQWQTANISVGGGAKEYFLDPWLTGTEANQANRLIQWLNYFKAMGSDSVYKYYEQGDTNALPKYNQGDVTTWLVDTNNLPNSNQAFQSLTDPNALFNYQPTLPKGEVFTKTVSPVNPQGAVVTSSAQGQLQASPSLVDVLKNTGATGDTLANAVTAATKPTYTTPSGAVSKPSGQLVSGPTAPPGPGASPVPSALTTTPSKPMVPLPTGNQTTVDNVSYSGGQVIGSGQGTPMQSQASAMQSQLGSTGGTTPTLPKPPTFTGTGASGTAPTPSPYPSAPTPTAPPSAPTLSPYQPTQAPSFGSLPQYQAPTLPQGNVPTAPTAPGLVNSADQYLQSYLATLSPTTQETGYQQQLAGLQGQQASIAASRDLGVQAVGEQPIATPFVTGQQTAITSRAATQMGALGAQQVPLQAQLALEQAKRQAAMDVNKTQLTYAQQKDQTQNEYSYNIYQTQLNERARTLDENYRQQQSALQQAQQTYENQLTAALNQQKITQQEYENRVNESRYQTETQNANAQQQFNNQMAAIQQQNAQAQQAYQNTTGQTQYQNELAQQQFSNQMSLAQEERLSKPSTSSVELSPGSTYYTPSTGASYTAPTTASQNTTTGNTSYSAPTINSLQTGKTVQSGNLVYSPTDYTSAKTQLLATRGSDGYVDPAVYVELYNQWIQNGGLESDFKQVFPVKDFVNPAPQSDPKVSSIIQRLRGTTSTGGGISA